MPWGVETSTQESGLVPDLSVASSSLGSYRRYLVGVGAGAGVGVG